MKLYALINWGEGVPRITTVNMMALVAVDRAIIEKSFAMIKDKLPKEMRVEIVEFESTAIIPDKKATVEWPT